MCSGSADGLTGFPVLPGTSKSGRRRTLFAVTRVSLCNRRQSLIVSAVGDLKLPETLQDSTYCEGVSTDAHDLPRDVHFTAYLYINDGDIIISATAVCRSSDRRGFSVFHPALYVCN